jgi:hypothetical protein
MPSNVLRVPDGVPEIVARGAKKDDARALV